MARSNQCEKGGDSAESVSPVAACGESAFPPPSELSTVPPRRRWWIALLVVGGAGLAALILIVVNFGEINAFAGMAAKARPGWLALGLVSQAATYLCVAFVWRLVLTRLGAPGSWLSLMPLGVAKLFADQALPSGGLTGSLLVVRGLGRRGVPPETAFVAFMFGVGSFFVAFLLAALFSLALLALKHRATPAVTGAVLGFLLVVSSVIAIAVVWAGRPHAARPKWIARVPWASRAIDAISDALQRLAAERALFAEAVGVQIALRGLDGLTLWFCFHAVGASAPYWACFVAIVIGSITATVAPIPMGLGTFEGGSVGALALLGAPIETALTVTLLFRGLSLWLPLVPGFFISQRELRLSRAARSPPG